jgi:hypothetical protein
MAEGRRLISSLDMTARRRLDARDLTYILRSGTDLAIQSPTGGLMDEEDRQDLANPLGISGQPVPQDESDRIRASNDEASVRRRRERAGLGPDGDDRTTDGLGDLNNDPDGAAGIDMGYGGEGTDIQPGPRRSSI